VTPPPLSKDLSSCIQHLESLQLYGWGCHLFYGGAPVFRGHPIIFAHETSKQIAARFNFRRLYYIVCRCNPQSFGDSTYVEICISAALPPPEPSAVVRADGRGERACVPSLASTNCSLSLIGWYLHTPVLILGGYLPAWNSQATSFLFWHHPEARFPCASSASLALYHWR
jgi:hypothetical protein